MAAYLEATARSFPNPISSQEFTKPFKRPSSSRYRSDDSAPELGTGTDYYITFQGSGPGSMPLGKDIVHYIGDNEPTCVGNCNGSERQPIYRFYRGAKRDHKYTNQDKIQKRDMGAENESWSKAASGYNAEPRSGRPVFWILDKQASGTVPLKAWYSYFPDNTALYVGTNTPPSTGSGKGKYKEVCTLGYVYTSAGDAPGLVPLYHYRHGSLSATKGLEVDDFYTTNPASEVDLSGGPIAPKKALEGRYQYQGILCYVFQTDTSDAPQKQVRDVGLIGPTGQCVNKTGWYQFDTNPYGIFGRYSYFKTSDTPGVIGFGNPTNASLISAEANFEWLYGLNGAIKAAVPRFLGFEDSYDSQFYYYLYDTTYPWNGPIFGIQYALNDIPCCPNTTCPDPNTGRSSPCCIKNTHYYSHFYQIREDSWQTTKTRISINDISTVGVKESFQTIDTDSRRILFRYTGGNTSGRFKRGDKINGWDIASVVYYGDEIKAGLMELQAGGTTGAAFTYNGNFTSDDGAIITVLAGYGIPNKAAFAGVYEFPKRISYWKVQINPKALIPHRTLDRAEAEAVIDNNGGISEIKIINGGRGYKNPTVEAINPKVLEDFSAGALDKFMKDGVIGDGDANEFPTPDSSYTIDNNVRDTYKSYGVSIGALPYGTDKNNEKIKLKKAVLKVAEIDDLGCITKIRVVDAGAGYSQDEPPTVFITEPETFAYESPPISSGNKSETKDTITDMGASFASKFQGFMPAEEYAQLNNYMQNDFVTATTGPQTAVVDTYIRAPDIDKNGKTKLCFDIPSKCISIPVQGQLTTIPDNWDSLFTYTSLHPGVAAWEKQSTGDIADGFRKADEYIDQMDSVYGAFGGKSCIEMNQPKLYNIRRWFDMPCAYLDIGDDGEEKAFGYMPYKYCASDQSEAQFRVSLEVEGKTTGSLGADFMNFLDGFQKPRLTPSRKVSGGYRTWSCTRSSINGRCYRDPNNANDIVFVPVGLDENTFDYNRNGYSEYEQFRLWLGDNLTGGGLTTGSNSWSWVDDETTTTTTTNPDGSTSSSSTTTSYGGTNSSSYTAFTVDCNPDPANNNVPNHDCWDKYVRATGAPSDAPLDVYCGWDTNGNPMAGERFWEITGPDIGTITDGYTTPTGPVNPFCASCASGYSFLLGFTGGGFGTSPACGLEQVNDASIAIDPQRIYDHGDGVGKVMQMGGYDGTMLVRNWLTGGTIALGRTVQNLGNPYFDECDGGRNWTAGKELNDDII